MLDEKELLEIFERFWEELTHEAIGAVQVNERLLLVPTVGGPVQFGDVLAVAADQDLIEVVNSTGSPFIDQAHVLIPQARAIRPQAVLLGGTGRQSHRAAPGRTRRILAAQIFAPQIGIQVAQIAPVHPEEPEPIAAVGAPRRVASPESWVQEILRRDPEP
jgi:hypothetical protein